MGIKNKLAMFSVALGLGFSALTMAGPGGSSFCRNINSTGDCLNQEAQCIADGRGYNFCSNIQLSACLRCPNGHR